MKMVPGLVSAVLPVYNGEKFVASAIESALEQSYDPLEIIVVDDGSTDSSIQIVEGFQDVKLIRQKNQGAAAARNTGVLHCAGEYVAFLDHDDRWEPDKTRIQVSFLQAHPMTGFVLGTQRLFVEPGARLPDWIPESRLKERIVCAGTGTTMVRRAVFDRVGPFNTEYVNGEDTEWFVRAIEQGFELGVAEDATILRRYHGGNATYDAEKMRKSLFKIMHASLQRKREQGTPPSR